LRFIARDPILTGILKVTKLPVQSTLWRFVNALHLNVARQILTIMQTMRERVWTAANVKLEVVTIDTLWRDRSRFDPFLQRNHLIVASHRHYGSESQALGKMHGADRSPAAGCVSTLSSSTLYGILAPSTAPRARCSSAAERTKTPISCGTIPR
jgi:hypothetical protein